MKYSKFIEGILDLIKTSDTRAIFFSGSRSGTEETIKENYADYDFFIITFGTDKVKIWTTEKSERVECFYYSQERFENCLRNDDPILIRALATGKIVYEQDSEYCKTLLRRVQKRFKSFKISDLTKSKLSYRVDMIEKKISSVEQDDNITKKWLVYYALPFILKALFFINGKTTPSVQYWIREVKKLKIKPDITEHYLEEILVNTALVEEVTAATLVMLRFIKKRFLWDSKFSLEFVPAKSDQTTII